MSVRLSIRMEQLGSHGTDFHAIWFGIFFENLSRKYKFYYNLKIITGTICEDQYYMWRPILYVKTNTICEDQYYMWGPILYVRTNTICEDQYYMWGPILYVKTNTIYEDQYYMWRPILYVKTNTICEDQYTHLDEFLLEWETFRTNVLEKIETHFDVITSLVSLVYWGFRCEKVTSQH
jgi:hypothetical protein